MSTKSMRQFMMIGLFALAYFGAAKLGLLLATLNDSASPVWPATGLAFALLALFGLQMWPAIAIGAFAANYLTDAPILAVLLIAIGNTAEALVGALIIKKLFKPENQILENQTEATGIILASTFATSISATVGVCGLAMSGVFPWSVAGNVWITWWIGDALGGLVVAPTLMALWTLRRITWQNSSIKIGEMAISFIIVAAVVVIVFFSTSGLALLYLIFPALLLSIVSFGSLGARAVTLLVCFLAIGLTSVNLGPFIGGTLNENLIHLQLFLASVAITALMMIGFQKSGPLKLPGMVLIVGWLLCGALFYSFHENERTKDDTHFTDIISETELNIKNRMEDYEDVLLGGVGFFSSSNGMGAKNWKEYLTTVRIKERFPGVGGVAVILPVQHGDLARYSAKIRALGISDFSVKAVPGHDSLASAGKTFGNHYVVTFIEPLEENDRVLGIDVGSEPTRRRAAELSRDTGRATLTTKITLVQDREQRPGFILFYPMYKFGSVLNTVEQRRTAFVGWIDAPILAADFFKGVLGKYSKEVSVFVYEGDPQKSEDLLFRSDLGATDKDLPKFDKETQIELFNRKFTLAWKKSGSFISSHDTTSAWAGFCGAIVSLLLANLVVALESIGRRARAIADKKTAQLEEQQMKMLASSRMSSLGEMAAGIAHEINNPLAIISLDLGQIAQSLEEPVNFERIRGALERGEATVLRIAKIINGLRRFSRDGSKEPFEVTSVKSIVDDSLGLCGERFRHHEIEIRAPNVDPTLTIECRSVEIVQTILNLLNNAVDAASSSTQRLISIGVEDLHTRVCLSVSDTGPGIPLDIRDKIMRPFFTTKEAGKGTGLGLAISKGIIDAHRGEFILEVGVNTCFKVILPKKATGA